MDSEASLLPLQRSVSQQSYSSATSRRSNTVRGSKARKLASHPSSSASSIAASDKSLTSFPSISPESPKTERDSILSNSNPPQDADSKKKSILDDLRAPVASIVDGLTFSNSGQSPRGALFEDSPLSTQKIPGALHQADDEHIERLIARHSAVGLVRQISEDLAQRDAQIALLRRRADERERLLRRIIRECGLSNLELETRLRAIENENRSGGQVQRRAESGLSDLMSDAMRDTVAFNAFGQTDAADATIRASSSSITAGSDAGKAAPPMRGWKDYIWGGGGGGSRKSSRASSINGEASKAPATVIKNQTTGDRRPPLQDDLFNPPENKSARSSSRASSVNSGPTAFRKTSTSIASLALRLVAGGTVTPREGEGSRGRSSSAAQGETSRTDSVGSVRTTQSARGNVAPPTGGPKALMAMRRTTPAPIVTNTRVQAYDRWDTMAGSPPVSSASRQESYGPVEMDTILPPEIQPPTLTQMYGNFPNSEYLTDRFGFIYDQRRKKRQREATRMASHLRKGSRTEMLTNGRPVMSPMPIDDTSSTKGDVANEERPESPSSIEERVEEGKPKRWQDYLMIATFPTELLSHTPSISVPSLEVLEGTETPKSPGLITSDERGFVPPASTTSALDSDTAPATETDMALAGTLVKEDVEPVKLLLQQLSDVHDSLQREKTVRWNDFMRKVRAERKREGDAAAAAAVAAAEARFERPAVILPEAKLADGEMIGVAGLGNKGKVGRAKWNEFKNLVLGGIPVAYRAKIWSECSGASALRNPGYYEDLTAPVDNNDDPIVVSQIEMDINRTLTDNIFFRKGPGVSKLNEVLLAYSRRNADVGYCQGMNLITANLLLITPSAEDAFWILTSIIENILPQGYYDHSLRASRADQQVLRQYVADVLPKLSQHLEDLSIELEALTFQWFLSVFTDCLSAEALFRVWDVVLCTNDGSTFLFQVALALLKLNEPQLLQCDSPAAVYTYINHQMTNHAISIDGLIHASEGLRKVVKREDVESRRDRAIQAEVDLLRQREERNSGNTTTGGGRKRNVGGQNTESGTQNEDALDIRDPIPMDQENSS
jgi:small G protein signaling modulator 3